MKFTIEEPRRGQDQDPNQSNQSPTSAQLLKCTASSDQRPAAGQVTGDAPVASYRSRDSMMSEVEFQRQLALGSSSSNLEFCGDDLENYQICAGIQLSLGGHWRGDAGRKEDEFFAKPQSEQYWAVRLLLSIGSLAVILNVITHGIQLETQNGFKQLFRYCGDYYPPWIDVHHAHALCPLIQWNFASSL